MKYRQVELKETGYGFAVKACGRDGLWQGCDRITVRVPEADRATWIQLFRRLVPRATGPALSAMLEKHAESAECTRTLTRRFSIPTRAELQSAIGSLP